MKSETRAEFNNANAKRTIIYSNQHTYPTIQNKHNLHLANLCPSSNTTGYLHVGKSANVHQDLNYTSLRICTLSNFDIGPLNDI